MVERTGAVPGQNQEHGRTGHGDEVERQQKNKLDDLSQRERRIDRTGGWCTETTWRVTGLRINNPRRKHKLFLTLIHKDGVEYIHQCLVHKECLEQGCNYNGAFAQYQECAVHPCAGALEDGQERNLRQICEEEEQEINEARQENDGKETGLEQGPDEPVRREIVDALGMQT